MTPTATSLNAPPLNQVLENWTERLLDYTLRPCASSDAAKSPAVAFASFRDLSRLAARPLLERTNTPHPLCRLPTQVMTVLCCYLDLRDRLALSHVSREIRRRLLGLPQAWLDLTIPAYLDLFTLGSGILLEELLSRTQIADGLLALSLALDEDNVLSSIPLLANNLHRISRLRICIRLRVLDSVKLCNPSVWQAALDAVVTPVPYLRHFSLFVRQNILIYEPGGTLNHNIWAVKRHPLPLPRSVFTGFAPGLRSCRLRGVCLPDVGHGSISDHAFSTISCLDYFMGASGSLSEIERVLSMLPLLHTLALTAWSLEEEPPDAAARQRDPAKDYPMLKNLFLRIGYFDNPADVCAVIPFSRLRHFDVLDDVSIIGYAYAEGMRTLVAGLEQFVVSVQRDGVAGGPATVTTIRASRGDISPSNHIPALASVTWLALHELLWTDVRQLMPPMSAVTTLCIRLASCGELRREVAHRGEAQPGIFTLSPDSGWHLPLLRELRITAPASCAYCTADVRRGSISSGCSAPMSIALPDVVQFVRSNLSFDALTSRLDSIRLSGFRITGLGFDEAWEELRVLAGTVELVEKPDVIHDMDLPPLDGFYNLETLFTGRPD